MSDHWTMVEVQDALERCKREGLPYTGPSITWKCGTLAATCPEPHIALSAEYLADNGLDATAEYIDQISAWARYEAGYRAAVEHLRDGLGMYAHAHSPAPLPYTGPLRDPRLSPLANTILDWMRA